MAILCESYWLPIYGYVRSRGYSRDEAEDITQGYFLRFLDRGFIDDVDPEKGKFRSFLLVSLKHFLVDEWHRARAQKRGGGAQHLSLDFPAAENIISEFADSRENPDRIFDIQWAKTLLARALTRLREEQDTPERKERFEILRGTIESGPDASPMSREQMAATLGIESTALKVAIHRLRKRYTEIVMDEVRETLLNPDEASQEFSYLTSLFN